MSRSRVGWKEQFVYCAHCGVEVVTLEARCPSCDKPANGAPAPPDDGRSPALIVVMVIGSVLAVIAVIGMVAAIAIPNLLNAINRSRAKRTMADMRTISAAIESHGADHLYYPDSDSIEGLAESLEPTYVTKLPQMDGWRTSFEYLCWQEDPDSAGCDRYVIASSGRDKVMDTDDLSLYSGSQVQTRDFDCDIVYCNGSFVQLPDGF